MDALDTGKDKIKKICDILKTETLEPAKQEAERIIEVAQAKAQDLIRDAESKASTIAREAAQKMQKERELFESSMRSACKQAQEGLRQEIEKKLFNDSLSTWVEKQTADPSVAASLIKALVEALEKEGTSADFSALIPKKISAEKVNAQLTKNILDRLREKAVVVGDFAGGIQIKLHDQNLTLDLSDEALKELLGKYIRKNFRDLLFQ